MCARGEPLAAAAPRLTAEPAAAMAALAAIADRVAALHAVEIVHRDLKPATIVRVHESQSWALVDFGCAAPSGATPPSALLRASARSAAVAFAGCSSSQTGSRRGLLTCRGGCGADAMVPLAFSLAYAAPEVVAAFTAGDAAATASTAADVWSLGVVAFELLSGRRAFPPGTAVSVLMDAMVGVVLFPWEGASHAQLRPLGALQDAILQCLSREPRERPTAAAFLAQVQAALP